MNVDVLPAIQPMFTSTTSRETGRTKKSSVAATLGLAMPGVGSSKGRSNGPSRTMIPEKDKEASCGIRRIGPNQSFHRIAYAPGELRVGRT